MVDGDLSPERRLQGTHGQGLATYRELVRNMSTKTRPEGGALTLILDRWIDRVQALTMEETGLAMGMGPLLTLWKKDPQGPIFPGDMVHGFDFARLLSLYYEAYRSGDDAQKALVIKWFRGEYETKTEARKELGVNIIITDDDWYEYLKIFAYFLKQAGYAGFLS